MANESVTKTISVAVMCIVCAIVVSSAAVVLNSKRKISYLILKRTFLHQLDYLSLA